MLVCYWWEQKISTSMSDPELQRATFSDVQRVKSRDVHMRACGNSAKNMVEKYTEFMSLPGGIFES